MPIGDVTVHVGVVLETESSGSYAQGEPAEVKPVIKQTIDCLLQIPRGGDEDSDAPKGRRKITRPMIIFEPFDVLGADFSLAAEDSILITAPELTGPDPVLWQVVGDPTPFAPPGDVIGYEANLRRVED